MAAYLKKITASQLVAHSLHDCDRSLIEHLIGSPCSHISVHQATMPCLSPGSQELL